MIAPTKQVYKRTEWTKYPLLLKGSVKKSRSVVIIRPWLLAVLSFFFLAASQSGLLLAADPARPWPLKPALIGDSTNSFAVILRYPPKALENRLTGAVFFYCDVDKTGKASNFEPFRVSTNHIDFLKATKWALEHARFEPATVNGKATRVGISMTVFFLLKGGEAQIRIFMDTDEQAIVAGENVIAAQVIGGYRDSPKGLYYPPRALDYRREGEVEVKFVVDVEGRPGQLKVVKDTAPQAGFSSVVVRHLENSRFIPTFINGRPVEFWASKEYVFVLRR